MKFLTDLIDNNQQFSKGLAAAGFMFSVIFATSALLTAWILENPVFMEHVASIIGVIIGATTANYTMREWTKAKHGSVVTSEPTESEGEGQ